MIKLNVKEGKEFADVHTMAVIQAELQEKTIYWNNIDAEYWFYDFKCRGLWVQSIKGIAVDEFDIRLERI